MLQVVVSVRHRAQNFHVRIFFHKGGNEDADEASHNALGQVADVDVPFEDASFGFWGSNAFPPVYYHLHHAREEINRQVAGCVDKSHSLGVFVHR